MKHAALSLAQTPPLSVPFRFFLTAPLFTVLCGATLFWVGPEILSSRWNPALLAATHFLTLGFLSMIMMGALQQLTPVLMGARIPSPETFSTWVHLLLTLGTLALAGGWLWQQELLFGLAGLLLGLAITGFVLVLLGCLHKARSSHATVHTTIIALIALVVTVLLGVYLVMGYVWNGFIRLPRMIDLHMTWGLIGWVSLLIMGVTYQVVPMFQITPDYPRPMMQWFTRIMFILIVCWSLVLVFMPEAPWILLVVGSLLALGLIIFSLITLRLLSQRRRRIPDVTLNFWRVAMVSLLLVIIVWGLSVIGIHERLGLFAGVLMIVGFAMSAISGMLYKIAPFLIWLHISNYLQAQGRGQYKAPNMRQVIPERYARLHFKVHSAMLLLVFLAVFWPHYLLRPAALLLIFTALILWWNLFSALRLHMNIAKRN